MTTKPARIAGIPGGDFPSNHACKAARRMNQARNRAVGNTLFMRTPSPVHGSCDHRPFARWRHFTTTTRILLGLKDPGHSSKMTPSCKWPINPKVLKIERGLHVKMPLFGSTVK